VTSVGNNYRTAPNPQELEISVFGPGFGECVVVHFGNGEWGIVDSCLDPDSKRPAALDYLESLGVDVEKSVRIVVASHWHDDHVDGISLVFKAAKSAIFVCTEAVQTADFNEILSAWTGTRFLSGGSGVDELHSIMVELKKRSSNTDFPPPVRASVNKLVWERKTPPNVIVKALSPSDAAVLAATARLKYLSPKNSKLRRRVPSVSPNDASVVLALQVGEHRVLLGADLEVTKDAGFGWIAVVNGFDKQQPKHQGFKIPHHGSPTAYHEEVWNQMLVVEPWAVTTPFVFGGTRLPSQADSHRILRHTSKAYLTAPPQPVKFRDPNRTVEKTVNEATLAAHFVPGRYGQVRIRKSVDAPVNALWGVELFGNALTMSDYVRDAHYSTK